MLLTLKGSPSSSTEITYSSHSAKYSTPLPELGEGHLPIWTRGGNLLRNNLSYCWSETKLTEKIKFIQTRQNDNGPAESARQTLMPVARRYLLQIEKFNGAGCDPATISLLRKHYHSLLDNVIYDLRATGKANASLSAAQNSCSLRLAETS